MTRALNRYHARRAARVKADTGFVYTPEPRTIGRVARGRQMLAGNLLFAGHLIQAPGRDLWQIDVPDAAFFDEIQGFAWLDDLAAVGDADARALAQDLVLDWIQRYGAGHGPGWTPDLTGRRLIRWINHALLVQREADAETSAKFYRSLAQQTKFLSKRWHATAPGLARFEALTGMIYAGLALEGMAPLTEPATAALARACDDLIDAQGGLSTRNPEELLEVFTLLTWAAAAMSEAGRATPPAQTAAIARIAPTLRTLRHADGSLARFHGGGRGQEGWLDHALAASGIKARPSEGLAMGYARLAAGRTSLIVDAAPPAQGAASRSAHASTLAFELSSGRRQVVVSCGSGETFGRAWRRAGRATPSHSTLVLDGTSSARMGAADHNAASEELTDGPQKVPTELSAAPDGHRFQGGHDGFVATHGITHARTLELTFDGRAVAGEDMLLALEDVDKRRFDQILDAAQLAGVPFAVRFHLHPEAEAALDLGGAAASITLKSGEIWIFRHDGQFDLAIEPSVYLEKGRLRPRATQQVVLSGRAMQYATRVRWSLSKAQETAIGLRDLARDDFDMTQAGSQ